MKPRSPAATRRSREAAIELPDSDRSVETLGADARARAARMWRARAAGELKTSAVFANLHRTLIGARGGLPVLRLAARAIADELRHAEICAKVAARYAGAVPLAPGQDQSCPSWAGEAAEAAGPLEPPKFHGCSDEQGALLFVIIQCCISETIAVSYLKTCLEQAKGPIARAGLRALLADEVDHSRLGWAHLASDRVGPGGRALVAEAMPQLLQTAAEMWLADPDGVHAAAPVGHGSISSDDTRAVVRATVEEIIAPGLAHVGVDPRPAQSWLARARPRSFEG